MNTSQNQRNIEDIAKRAFIALEKDNGRQPDQVVHHYQSKTGLQYSQFHLHALSYLASTYFCNLGIGLNEGFSWLSQDIKIESTGQAAGLFMSCPRFSMSIKPHLYTCKAVYTEIEESHGSITIDAKGCPFAEWELNHIRKVLSTPIINPDGKMAVQIAPYADECDIDCDVMAHFALTKDGDALEHFAGYSCRHMRIFFDPIFGKYSGPDFRATILKWIDVDLASLRKAFETVQEGDRIELAYTPTYGYNNHIPANAYINTHSDRWYVTTQNGKYYLYWEAIGAQPGNSPSNCGWYANGAKFSASWDITEYKNALTDN